MVEDQFISIVVQVCVSPAMMSMRRTRWWLFRIPGAEMQSTIIHAYFPLKLSPTAPLKPLFTDLS
jgi:hypothetical protein